jgi:hypothetical protein
VDCCLLLLTRIEILPKKKYLVLVPVVFKYAVRAASIQFRVAIIDISHSTSKLELLAALFAPKLTKRSFYGGLFSVGNCPNGVLGYQTESSGLLLSDYKFNNKKLNNIFRTYIWIVILSP